MRKLSSIAVTIVSISFVGCSMISSNYVASSDIHRQCVSPNGVEVFYDKNDVPYKYKEIGRVYLKNINYWADRDPGGQIAKIRKEAAAYGADAVILINEMRREMSYAGNGGNAGDVFQYSGIAIAKNKQ